MHKIKNLKHTNKAIFLLALTPIPGVQYFRASNRKLAGNYCSSCSTKEVSRKLLFIMLHKGLLFNMLHKGSVQNTCCLSHYKCFHLISAWVFSTKSVGFWGSAPGPGGGAYSAPPHLLGGREGCPPPPPPRDDGGGCPSPRPYRIFFPSDAPDFACMFQLIVANRK